MIKEIRYAGAILEVPEFLVDLWPYELPLDLWPSYCGAGDGIGDWLIPDCMYGVRVCPACFIHDIDWAIAEKSYRAFQAANNRLRRNLNALTNAHLSGLPAAGAVARAGGYWAVVSGPFGWINFDPCGEDPWRNPVVRSKLNRLARAKFRLDEARN